MRSCSLRMNTMIYVSCRDTISKLQCLLYSQRKRDVIYAYVARDKYIVASAERK